MAIQFSNLVKGQVTQSILATLLERAGYRVTRLGIEELFAEVKHIDLAQYQGLHLPKALRYLPDLLVANSAVTEAYLVEVKFRRRFDDGAAQSLHHALQEQREHWPESHGVIMIAEPFVDGGRFHQDFIRVVSPHDLDLLVDSRLPVRSRWDGLKQLQQIFTAFSSSAPHQAAADLITPALRSLSSL